MTLLEVATRGALLPLSLESSSSSSRCASFLRSSCSRRRFSFSSWGIGSQEWTPSHRHGVQFASQPVWMEALLCARPRDGRRGHGWEHDEPTWGLPSYMTREQQGTLAKAVGGWLLKKK